MTTPVSTAISKQRDVAHRDGDAEVAAKPILEIESASHRVKRLENKDSGFRDRVEDHVRRQHSTPSYWLSPNH